MPLNPEKIRLFLKKNISVSVFDAIDSTNNEAKRQAPYDSGVRLYAADHQTAGRGRRGHSFYSPKGTGLYMTLSLPQDDPHRSTQSITCAAAVAVCEAVEELCGVCPGIKWVNDVYLGGRKVAGILTELVCDSDNRPLRLIIGIGVNLKTEDFPEELADIAGNIGGADPERLCAAIADRLIGYSENNTYLEKYKALNLCIGRVVSYTVNDIIHTAEAVDIADDGGLIVSENGRLVTLNAGEISVKL